MLGTEKKDCFMPKIITLAIVLVAVATVSCLADQLAWNSRTTCAEAAKRISRDSIVLSYCSNCSNEHVEVWLVKGIIVAPTAAYGLFEVNVFGIRLYTSKEPFREKGYSEPVQYEAVTGDGLSRWFLAGIDLAYSIRPYQ